MKIDTVLTIVTYYNEENGYCVLKDENGKAFIGYTMFNPRDLLGIPVVINCKKTKSKYGIQYKFSEIEHNIPPLFHFLTGVIKGVQKSAAIEIANKYETINNLEKALKKNENEILKIKGIGKKSLEKLKTGLEKDKELYSLAEILLPYGVTPGTIKKIYSKYQDESIIKKLKKDPYSVLTSVRGIGFKKADKIVLKAKLADSKSIYRAKAGIVYIFLSVMEDKGETVFKRKDIKEKFYELISKNDFSDQDFDKAFNLLIKEEKLILVDKENDSYSFTTTAYIEKSIFNFVKKDSFSFLSKGQELTAQWHIEQYEKENNIKLDKNQKKAVIEALISECPVYIIAGYAGTGKTTTSKALVDFLKKTGKKIVGCALSGAAANRLKSIAGIKSYTIHSLLGYRRNGNEDNKGESMFKYNSKNPLDYDLIILDEASMVSASLIYHLMKAINTKKTKILMLGDDAQLPPIGWGEVFSDLLNWKEVPKMKLTKIYRQGENKVISVFAGEIRQGKVPRGYKEKKYDDFKFVSFNIRAKLSDLSPDVKKEYRKENNLNIKKYVLNGFSRYKEDILKSLREFKKTKNPELLKEYISRIQLISATRNGLLGTVEMNLEIKNILNPLKEKDLKDIDYIAVRNIKNGVVKNFSKFDKVIHLKNQDMFCSQASFSNVDLIEKGVYSSLGERVYNGQVGVITNIIPKLDKKNKPEDTYIEVYYPNEEYFAYYTKEDFFNEIIDLAYSITIHKSQGQEYKSVIIPVTFSHFNMLNAKLMYTAITRAKDRVILAGEDWAFIVACKKLEDIKRNTVLKHLIKEQEINKNRKEQKIDKNQENNKDYFILDI